MSRISRRHFLCSAAAGVALLPFGARSQSVSASQAFRFLAIGDWGNPKCLEDAKKVAVQMGETAASLQARFVVSTGDNFYPRGVTATDDPKWRTAYEDVYKDASLMCPWYVVLGNHDRDGNEQAQIDYALQSARWRLPSRYYTRTEPLPDGGTVDYFFLDTDPIKDLNWANRWLWSISEVQRQLEWLEEGLAKSRSAWKIVVGHHPVFSGGEHGNTPELVEVIRPLLDRYGVRAYINGHDHDLQHIVRGDVHYLTSGAGCSARQTQEVDGTRFARATLGFMTAEISSTAMAISFIDARGNTMYSAKIAPRP